MTVKFNYELIVFINMEKTHGDVSVTAPQRGLIKEGRPFWNVGAPFNDLGARTK